MGPGLSVNYEIFWGRTSVPAVSRSDPGALNDGGLRPPYKPFFCVLLGVLAPLREKIFSRVGCALRTFILTTDYWQLTYA